MLIKLDHDTKKLTPREQSILELFIEKGNITIDDISKAFNLTRGSANFALHSFTKKIDVKSERNPWRSPAIYTLA